MHERSSSSVRAGQVSGYASIGRLESTMPGKAHRGGYRWNYGYVDHGGVIEGACSEQYHIPRISSSMFGRTGSYCRSIILFVNTFLSWLRYRTFAAGSTTWLLVVASLSACYAAHVAVFCSLYDAHERHGVLGFSLVCCVRLPFLIAPPVSAWSYLALFVLVFHRESGSARFSPLHHEDILFPLPRFAFYTCKSE